MGSARAVRLTHQHDRRTNHARWAVAALSAASVGSSTGIVATGAFVLNTDSRSVRVAFVPVSVVVAAADRRDDLEAEVGPLPTFAAAIPAAPGRRYTHQLSRLQRVRLASMPTGSAASDPIPGFLTFEEWTRLPEDTSGEWVNGQLEEEEVATFIHEFVVSWLLRTLGVAVAERGGYMFGSETKFRVSPHVGRKPDAVVFLPGTRPPSGRASVSQRPPDIVVEVVSATPRDARRDRIEKMQEYASFGVRWYWIVDPELHTLEIQELGADGRYVHSVGATAGTIDVPGIADVRLELDALWSEVAKLAALTDEPHEE